MSNIISEIRFIGIRRGGQHGVINWLRAQKPLCDGVCVRHNLIVEDEVNPFVDVPENDCPHLLRTYENLDLKQLFDKDLEVSPADHLHYVLLLRDPFNLAASRMSWEKHPQRLTEPVYKDFIRLWRQHAREYLGRTKILPNKVVVNFNRWFVDQEYRRGLSEALSLEFSDVALNQVSPHGFGSSFDRQDYDGCAQKMKVLERYKQVADEVLYKAICDDKELCELSREIFGEIRS